MDGSSASAENGRASSGEAASVSPVNDARSGVSVFLFADIRGSTRFAAERGAEAAAGLASRFTALARDVAFTYRGSVSDTWGDEVLVEFASARDAVRAAVALQDSCLRSTLARPEEPLGVGVGIDVGEPATTEVVRSADALNIAARLCAAAKPGQALATRELIHLAGVVPGVVYEEAGRLRLKGVPGRTAIARVRSASLNSADVRQFQALVVDRPARLRRRRRRVLVAALTAAAVLAGVGVSLLRHRAYQLPNVPALSAGLIDASSGRLVGSVPVGHSPEGVALTKDALWVANTGDRTVMRIDLKTRAVVQTVSVDAGPVALTAFGENVWVVNSLAGDIQQISTLTGEVVGDPIPVGNQPTAITSGFGWLWVTNQADATITRLDPAEIRPPRTIDVGDSPDGITAGDGAVWVSNRTDNTVSRVDPDDLGVSSPIRVGAGPRGIIATSTAVWVANSLELTVSRINVQRRAVDHTVQVGDTPTALTADARSVWVSNAGDATLARIDPRTGEVTRRLYVGSAPHGLVLAGSRLWVVGQAYPSAAHRGGTLTIAWSGGFETVDPAVNYGSAWNVMHIVYDGLVGLHRTAGAAGFELVPDLAVSIPVPADGGRTYTFALRPGIQYSDGTALRASDLRRGIERAFSAYRADLGEGNPGYYAGIMGAKACMPAPKSCNLSTGIETDDAAGKVIFHLAQPDPDFLAKLALPFATAVPPGAPAKDVGTHPLPGTGPYMFSEYTPMKTATLIRNPHFKQWSSAAQPDGFPDMMRWVPEKTVPDELVAVEHGQADLADVSPEDEAMVARAYPAQYRGGNLDWTGFLVLNAAVRPFSNLKARQAVAYALSGDPIIAGFFHGSTACRLVPPDYPGSVTGCPYPNDLHQAKQLVTDSGTGHARVNVYFVNRPRFERIGKHVTAVLNQIGFDARLVLTKPDDYEFSRYDAGRPMNLEGLTWLPDFPSPSQFYRPLLGCGGLLDFAHSCNRTIEAMADAAAAAQLTDPGQGQRLWRQVYEMVDADARLVTNNYIYDYTYLLSPRVGNYRVDPLSGPDLGQMWVK